MRRCRQIIDLLVEESSCAEADVICLQEFWFEPTVIELFKERLEHSYSFHFCQRKVCSNYLPSNTFLTIHSQYFKPDGILILVASHKFEVVDNYPLSTSWLSSRVALFLKLKCIQSQEVSHSAVSVINY